MKKLEADVVIIAGGASGLSAAIAAAEKEASVIVFEKGSTTGGAANMGMGFLAVESHFQKEQMVDLTLEDAFQKFMDYTHWRVDARLVRKYFGLSASTVEWIENMGVEFLGAYKYFSKSESTWHIVKTPGVNKPVGRSASLMYKTMTDYAKEQGVEFYFKTPVKKILMENGRAVGVLAVDEKGEEIQADCSCVIVAAGGYGANPEMIKQYTEYEWGKDLYNFVVPGCEGEGLKMVWEAGGGRSRTGMETTYDTPGITGAFPVLSETMRQPNLMVNLDGRRIINEEIMMNTTYTGNAITIQKNKTAFTIIGESILDAYRENGLDFITYHNDVHTIDKWDAQLKEYFSGDHEYDDGFSLFHGGELKTQQSFWMADSLEDLAEQTGINKKALLKTVEEYNACCGKSDTFFGKPVKYMKKIEGTKYYAAKHVPSGYGSLGGILTNDDLEVLTQEGEKIPGLYACGVDACTIFGDSYCFKMPGNTMGFSLNSGRMAGMNAVDYIDSDDFVE